MPQGFITTSFPRVDRKANTGAVLLTAAIWAAAVFAGEEALAQCAADAASPANIVCGESPDVVDDPDGFVTDDTIQSLTINADVLVNDQDDPDRGNVGGVIQIGDPVFPVPPLPEGTLPDGSVLGDVLINGTIQDTGEISNALRLAGAVDGDLIVNGMISGGITGVWVGKTSNGSEIVITGDFINTGSISGGNNAIQISTEFPGDISVGVGGDFINSGDIIGDTNNDGLGDGISDTLSQFTQGGGTSGFVDHGTVIGNFMNQEGATISGGNNGISLLRIDGNFTNAGDIIANPNAIATFGTGVDLEELGGNFLNTATGTIDADFDGVGIDTVLGDVENQGSIAAGARAFDINQLDGSFANHGTLDGDVTIDVIGNGFTNTGSIMDSSQAVTFQEISGGFVNSGSIESTSSTQDGIGTIGTGTLNGDFVNEATGTISAPDSGANLFAFINGDVINRGTITGDSDDSGRGDGLGILRITGNFANEAGAQISGDTGLDLGDVIGGQAVNAGTITGNTDGDGDTDGAGVELNGPIDGGFFNQSGGEITGFMGVFADTFGGFDDQVLINAGTITGTGGIAIDMGFGNDVVEIRNGSTINGAVINAQTLRLGGDQGFTFDVSQVSTQNDESIQYRGVQTIEVNGTGTFTLEESQTNIGTLDLDVVSGTAVVNGDFSTGNTNVTGGTLGGTGTVGDLDQTGGAVAPGNSIGTLMVDGNFTQGPDGVLQIEIGPTGSNDLIDISGTADVDGTLDIILFDPFVNPGDTFTFLIADGGVLDGDFASVTTPNGLDVSINVGANQIDIEIISLILDGCEQTGLSVLCEGIDNNGFSNTVDTGLSVLVESDALVVNPAAIGLELGDGAMIDNQGTINNVGKGIEAGVGAEIDNSGTISSDGIGIDASFGGQVVNTATGIINADSFGVFVDGGPDGTGSVTNDGSIVVDGLIGTGIGLSGGAAAINNGTIDASNSGISDFDGEGVTVTNNGLITAIEGGIQVGTDAVVHNNEGGTIIVSGLANASAIASGGNNVQINNAGSVTSEDGSGIRLVGVGPFTINNSGSVTGATFGVLDGDNVTLTNEATGTIQAGNDSMDVEDVGDAVRLGENAMVINHGMITSTEGNGISAASGQVTNSGTIIATQPEGTRFDSFDAIAFSGDGTVTNEATGVITADDESIDINGAGTVTNHGLINGNGSNIIDIRGDSVIVNTGTIAQIDNNGDGIEVDANTMIDNQGMILTGSESLRINDSFLDDGDPHIGTLDNSGDILVDVDISNSESAPASAIFISLDEGRTFSVENSGTIESGVNAPDGTGTTGRNAFGLSGGTHLELNNQAGGLVRGAERAVLASAFGTSSFSIENHGTITGRSGTAIEGGIMSDTVMNAGTINGDVLLGAGNDSFTTDVGMGVVNSVVDGGDDIDDLGLTGSGSFDLTDIGTEYINFEGVSVLGGGAVTATGTSADIGSLAIDETSALTLAAGSTLTASGGTTISAGGTLDGNGTLESDLISEGMVSPGESIGTLMIDGNFSQGTDGVLMVEIGPTGSNDLIDISGTADLDGTLDIILFDTDVAVGDSFTFLIADGGILDNTFDTVGTPAGLDVQINTTGNEMEVEIVFLALGACVQTGLDVLCEGIDGDGFVNTVDTGLDVLVLSDAQVLNPEGNGLTLGDGNVTQVDGTINAAGNGVETGDENAVNNTSPQTIIADGHGILVGDNSEAENTGTIEAGLDGINGGDFSNGTMVGGVVVADVDQDGDFGFINKGSIAAGNNGITAGFDSLVINHEGATIVAGNNGVENDGAGEVLNRGDIDAAKNGIVVGDGVFSNLDNDDFTQGVTNSGTIIARDGSGIIAGELADITNGQDFFGGFAGDITATEDGIRAGGNATVIQNFGLIDAGDDGIEVTGTFSIIRTSGDSSISAGDVGILTADQGLIDNKGSISATTAGIQAGDESEILSSGTIMGEGDGIIAGSGYNQDATFASQGIINSGTIDVDGDGIRAGNNNIVQNTSVETINAGDDGMALGDGNDVLNTGGIDALDFGIYARSNNNVDLDGDGNFGITNEGTVDSQVDGIFAASNNIITNRGEIFARNSLANAPNDGDRNSILGTAATQQGTGIGVGSDNTVTNEAGATITAFDAGIATSLTAGTGNTITNRGAIDTVTLTSSEDFASDAGIRTGADNMVDNFGSIMSRDIGISTGSGSTVTNHADATITTQSRGIIVNSLNEAGGGTATNDGEINVGGALFGVAGFVINDGVTATNNGTVNSDGDGFFVNSGAGSTLNNNGTLNVADDGFDLFNNSTINNNAGGEVNATGGAASNAIESFGTDNTINNSGDLISTGGVGVALLGFGPNTVNNNAGGVIEGVATAIAGGGGDEVVFNAGTINGDVLLAGGADTFRTDVTTGTVNSVIDGGGGADALILQGTGTFELDEAINFESLSVQDGAAITGTGTGSDVGTSAIDGTSALTLAAESTLVTSGGLTIAGGGALNGTGTVDGSVVNNGTVTPGMSIGMLTVNDDFTQSQDGVLEIEFGPTGTNDLLAVGGEVVLDGTLDIILVDQNIETGDVFTIITAANGVVGAFDTVNNVNEIGNFEIIINPNSVQIGVLFLEGCIQTGSDVLCTGTDPDGFTNVEDDALDTFVEPDAIVNNPDGNGLNLGDNGTVDNQGTIDVAGDGINIGSGNVIKNSSTETIIAGGDGIDAGDNNDITNTGAITADGVGILAGFNNNMDLDEDGRAGIVNEGTIDAQTGISVDGFNSITNAAGAEITATDIGIFGIAQNSIVNNGLIESDDDGIVVGIDVEGEGLFFILDGGNTVTNNGTIIAMDDGIVAHSFDNTINNTSDLTITAGNDAVDITGEGNVLNNSGTLTGGDQGDGTGHGVDVTGASNTINNTGGTIQSGDGHGISLDDNNNTVVNDAGGVVDTTGTETGIVGLDGINAAGQANTITNHGMIDVARDGIALESFNTATNAADGTINAAGNGVFGVARNTIVNDGLIESDDDGIVVGIDIEGEGDFFILDGGNTVTNNGTIIAMDDGIVAHSFDNTITNTSDLTITAGDDGVDITGDGNVLNNSGTITGGTAGGANSHGVDITGDMNTVNNTGTIASLSAAAINASGNDILIDNAGGTITGGGMAPVAIQGAAGGQSVTNRMEGLITGDVLLGAGSDTYDLETGSVQDGAIDLGEDEGDTDTDQFILSGDGEGVFDGALAGAELLDKVDSGTFDLNGTITVDGVLMTRPVDVDNDGDGIADATVQVFDRVVGTTIQGGTLNIGGLILVDDDDDPETDPVLGPNTGATLVSPTVDVLPGARLGGHGTVVTDPSVLGGLFVSGAEADPLAPTGAQGVIAPGTSIGTLNVIGRVVFDSVQTSIINDVTVITNNGGRFEVDLNDTGGHDLLNVTAAGVATTDLGVPNDTTGPDGTPDGVTDSIDVEAVPTGDGTAVLGGTIDVILDPEFLDADQDGTPDLDADGKRIATADYTGQARVYDVLVAEGGVNSTFDTIAFDGGPNDGGVTVREDKPATVDVDETNRVQLFKGSIEYLADRVRITSIPDFEPSAQTVNQAATAGAIDGVTQYGLNTDPLHALAAQLGTSGDIPGGLDDLHGEWFNAFDEVGINISRTMMHQASLRSYEVRGGRRDNNAIAINVTDNSVTGASADDDRASFWLAGTFDFVEVDSNNGFIEYEFDTVSGYGGVDYLIDNNILIGITGGFGSTDVDFAGRAGEGDVDSWQVAGYASIFGPEWFVELSGGVGGMDIESTRDITFGTVNLSALADYNGDLSYVGGRGGYQFNLGDGFQVTPTVGLTYARVEQDGFTETGAAPVNLSIDETSFDSVRLEGVIRIAKTIRSGNGGWFTPYASVGVGHEFEDDLRAISGRFDGVLGSDFTVFGEVPRKTTALFGAGITAMIGSMLQLYFDYSGEIGGDYQDHAITGGAKLRF